MDKIKDYIPEILSIGDFRGRIRKVMDIIAERGNAFDSRLSELTKILETFQAEVETEEILNKHYFTLYREAKDIKKLCKSCLFNEHYCRDLPIEYMVEASYFHHVEIFGIRIGSLVSDALQSLKKFGVNYEEYDNYIYVSNRLVHTYKWKPRFTVHIYHDDTFVTMFYLQSTNASENVYDNRKDVGGYWGVLYVIDELFKDCEYSLKDISKEVIRQMYLTYFDVIEVEHTRWDTNIRVLSARQYNEENKPWWKKTFEKLKTIKNN